MIKDKSFLKKIFNGLSNDTKLLIFDFVKRMKISVLESSFKVMTDMNKNTYDLVDKVIQEKSKKCLIEKEDPE